MPTKTAAPVEEAQRVVQLVVFRVGDEEFAMRIGAIREIIQAGAIIPVPDAPRFVTGVANVRGDIAAVINLAQRFSLPPPKRRAATPEDEINFIIITEQEQNLFGLLVDELIEVLRIANNDIKDAPQVVTKVHGEYIEGVITREERLIILLDMGRVLSEREMEAVAEVQRRHEEQPPAASPTTRTTPAPHDNPQTPETPHGPRSEPSPPPKPPEPA